MFRFPPQSYGVAVPRGMYRLRLYNELEFQRLQKKYPDFPREYIIAMCLDDDTGWCKNTVTDLTRRNLVDQPVTTNLDIFISEASAPGNVDATSLQFTYASQVPNQVADPTTVLDADALLQTRTVTFTPPAVTRNINTVGLVFTTASTPTHRAVHGIAAYSVLSSTRVQTTVQTADVQYKLTWSFE